VALLTALAGPFCARADDPASLPRGDVLPHLVTAADTRAAYAADATPPPAAMQPPVFSANTTVTAPDIVTTPADYQSQQTSAPEEVVIQITTLKPQAAKGMDASIGSDAKLIAARAVVLSVVRTKTGLKVGSFIYLLYGYAPPAPGQPGAPPIPIVELNATYHAFLTGGPGDTPYQPAAGAQSFLNPKALEATPAASAAAKYKPTGPLADPAILPTPNNPKPKGAVHLTGDNLDQFVQLVQTGTQWGASIAHADPLPLQTQDSSEPPALISFYSTPLGAPATQPTILLYRASVRPASPHADGTPATGTLTSIRALVISSNGHLLGDAPWTRILSDDSQPPLPPFTWIWSSYKVDVTDPDTQKVQTIWFAPQNPPPAPTTPATPADAK
jgi:hypothetical protein